MSIIISPAENGYVVENRLNDDERYYFVALDINDACSIVHMLLEEDAYQNADMTSVAFEQVPNA